MKRAGWLLAGGAALLAAGCGQKGALYLPDKNAQVVTTPPPPTSAAAPCAASSRTARIRVRPGATGRPGVDVTRVAEAGRQERGLRDAQVAPAPGGVVLG